MIVVVMGVSGSGKTRIGAALAEALRCAYLDADTLHSESNVESMRRGVPLTDADRAPWLATVHSRIVDAFDRGQNLVVGCSALRKSYRETLEQGLRITWVYLKGSEDLIRLRLEQREGHFLKADMLASQLAALEEPSDAIIVDITHTPGAIVEQVVRRLRLSADVRVLADLESLSARAAEMVVTQIDSTVKEAGRCSIALSGGSTPRPMHELLASRFRDAVPWNNVHVFWGDDRYVPHDDERSNYRMAQETLLNHVPCPPANVHPMPTHFADPEEAARAYEQTLRDYFGTDWPRFDVVLLGVGADGHTASLFPGSSALDETERWVLPVVASAESPTRLTLTLPVLNRASHTHFLVSGSDKAHVLERISTGLADSSIYPAAAVRPAEGDVVWWVDADAANHRRHDEARIDRTGPDGRWVGQ